MKTVSHIQRNPNGHWGGDGFPVRSIFSYNENPAAFSPFLLLDYGGPTTFEPTTKRRDGGPFQMVQLWVNLPAPAGHTTAPLVLSGRVKTPDGAEATGARWFP